MLLFTTSFFAAIVYANGECLLYDQPNVNNNICQANIDCKETTNNFNNVIRNWGCLERHRYVNYNVYGYGNSNNKPNVNIYIQVLDIDINISNDPLIDLKSQKNYIKSLTMDKGNLILIPKTISEFNELINLYITYNKIESLDFNMFRNMRSMQMLNVSHNYISDITVYLDDFLMPNVISTIDISYNELESIPDNCFAMFSHLKYLDLSYNRLVKFDILTFEGMIQLETLHLSHNKISEIGQNFARFVKLKNLTLDHNQLMFITDLNLKMLINLEKLNLSSNLIKNIEDHSFATLKNLKELDLTHNSITIIHKTLFNNNINIYKLILCNNEIETIERGAFRANNITYFDIQYNSISGSIESDMFSGIFTEKLDLSGGKLSQLGDRAFSALGSDLKYLNLSANIIQLVSKTAFNSLKILSILDLSFNKLYDIDYDTNNLTELTEYYLQYNKIKKITSGMFRKLSNLIKLDLSYNMLVDIELHSFVELKNLESLYLNNNNFISYLTENTFHGLHNVKILDLSSTRSVTYQNNSFFGMKSLIFLNSSHSQIECIEFEAYNSTAAIKIIDLSYNMLENFQINTAGVSQLSELYLNDNRIKNITYETFRHLRLLEKITLAHNNILYIDSKSLQTLPNLRYLNLISNLNMKLVGDLFNNLFLSQVSLKNVKTQFNFNKALNSSIMTLILSNCDIIDINSVFIYNLKNIDKLDVSSNKIEELDKGSFQSMPSLNWLDLSLNIISTIKPGTFLYTNMINFLNLRGNILQYLQFGVLDGLKNLRTLDLSNNALHIFGAHILYSTPHLLQLSLDNNNLASLDFKELSNTSISVLSIGGNTISCTILAYLKKNKPHNLNITAQKLDFNTENVGGVSCTTNISRYIIKDKNNDINITNEIVDISKIIEKVYNSSSLFLNETISKINTNLKIIPDHLNNVSQHFNQAQILINQHLSHSFSENKELLSQLVNATDNVANDIKLMISLLEINNKLTKLNDTYIDVIYKSLLDKTNFTQLNQRSSKFVSDIGHAEIREVKLDYSKFTDVKVLLYFIAICLAITIVFYVVTVFYKNSHRNSVFGICKNESCSSGHLKTNIIEME